MLFEQLDHLLELFLRIFCGQQILDFTVNPVNKYIDPGRQRRELQYQL